MPLAEMSPKTLAPNLSGRRRALGYRTGPQGCPLWRLGALVFRSDPFRIGQEVSHFAEWRRIVVWAVWTCWTCLRPEGRVPRGRRSRELGRSSAGGFIAFSGDSGRGWPAGRHAAARPAVYPAAGGAPVASPQSRILRRSGERPGRGGI